MTRNAMRSILMSFMLLITGESNSEPSERTASWLLSACQGVLNAPPGPDGGYLMNNDMNTGECIGTLRTIAELGSIYGPDAKPLLHFCVNPATTFTFVQLAQILNAYLQQHPDRLSSPANWAVLEAYARAYPCK